MKYLILIVSAINFLLGLVVILRSRKKDNVAFFFFALSASVWTFINFYLRIAQDVFFLRLSYAIGVLVATLGLFWTVLYLGRKISILSSVVISSFSALFCIVSVKTNLIIKTLYSVEQLGYSGETGRLFSLYALYLGILVSLIIIFLLKESRIEKDPVRKDQILFVLFGAVFFATTSFSVSFLVPTIFDTFNLTVLDNFGFSIFLSFIVYATIKHRLFNIKVIATELLVFSLWIFNLAKAVSSDTRQEALINYSLLAITIVIGIFLIRSVYKEVEAKEQIEKLAADLTAANERLKELDKLKSEFVSIASHQLRSPLTAIKGYSSLIMDGSFGKISYGVQEAVGKIFQASQALVIMVEDFLNVSRIEQGRLKFEFEKGDLEDLAKKVVAEQEPLVENAHLKISFSTDNQPPYFMKMDIGKVRQIITNLIDNAIKYTPSGSISVRLCKNVREGKLVLSVADTGVGIDKETIPTLFAKFTRAKDANKVNVMGTGLGLYIVKQIVDGHNGRVWVESKGKGQGSTFLVELEEDHEAAHAASVSEFAKNM